MLKTIFAVVAAIATYGRASALTIDDFEAKFNWRRRVIWCWNDAGRTKPTTDSWNCYRGKWWHNIMLPPKDHLRHYYAAFGENLARITNSFPTENRESGFDPNARNAHAIGYVRTLRKRGISTDITARLKWKAARRDARKENSRLCGSYETEDDTIKCLYRAHYHFYKWRNYARRSYAVRRYYRNRFGL